MRVAHLNEYAKSPCVVITYPYPLGRASGGARHVREIARHLGKLDARVIILAVSASLRNRFPRPKIAKEFLGFELDEALSRYSVEVIRVPQNPFDWRLDGLRVKQALKDFLKHHRVDIVLSFFQESAFLPSFLRSRNIKFGYLAAWQSYALALNGSQQEGIVHKFMRIHLNRQSIIKPYKQADILFANSRYTRDELINIIGVDKNRIVVCPLGVDGSFIEIPRLMPEEVTRFIFFGRIIFSKGVADAINALARLAAKGITNWNFRIIGQGDQEWARNLASECGIGDKVVVCGPVDDVGLRRELQQAHLAILPSHVESFGLSIAEAQAAGIPVVAYDTGSVPEIVENGVTGWLAPFRQVDQLAHSIEQAIQNPEAAYRAGLAGRERVKQLFSWEKTAATILKGVRRIMLPERTFQRA